MKEHYLEITFRHGKPIAAYYYLPRDAAQQVHRCEKAGQGMVIDYDADDRPIGVELTAPGQVTLADFNGLLQELGFAPISSVDFAPLSAA